MSNTEINSLFEITKSLESRGLYAQADKTRDIMVRLSQKSIPDLQTYINIAIQNIEILSPFLKAAGFSNFITAVKTELPKIKSLLTPGKAINLGFNIWSFVDLVMALVKIAQLSSKFNWETFFSGKDTTGQQIAIQILTVLSNFCFLVGNLNPVFNWYGGAFLAATEGFKVAWKEAEKFGYSEGGMPGGVKQMKAIESFNLNSANNVTDPDAKFIIDSIIKELGIGLDNPNAKENASKLPKILGGLDFFIPYIKKYDKKNKFKNLNDPTIPENLQLTSGLLDIQSKIKLFRGDVPAQPKSGKKK